MERMIAPKRPFYKAGPVMRLQKIPADLFARFVERRFGGSGLRCETGWASRSGARGQPPVRRAAVAHETWDDVRAAGRRRSRWRRLHEDAAPAAGRAPGALRGPVAAGHAAAAGCPAGRRVSSRAASSSRPTSVPATGWAALVRAVGAGRAAAGRPGLPRGRWTLRRDRFVVPGVGGPDDPLRSRREQTVTRRTVRPQPSRAARLGHVRLGQLRLHDHGDRRRLPRLLRRDPRRGSTRASPRTSSAWRRPSH